MRHSQSSARWLGVFLLTLSFLVVLTISGSFRGESDFGQADVQAKSVAKVVIK
jgi:hypothetical protein